MYKYIYIVILSILISGADLSYARGVGQGAKSKESPEVNVFDQLAMDLPHFHPIRLQVSLGRTPKFNRLPVIKTEVIVLNTFTDDDPGQSSEDKFSGTDTLTTALDGEIRANKEFLFERYGFNRAVENSLYFYSTKNRKTFLNQLKQTGKYIEKIVEIFREKNLPDELVFLPLIESGFNLHAYSPKKAAGLWQFIPGTAKKYGLKIDWWVDERRDPIKATIAASEYLSDLYQMFDSWPLALAAYNAGEGKIFRALRKTKTDDYWALRNTRYIKKETKNYVPSYIAATAIALDPESFGFEKVAYHTPLEYDEVTLASPMNLKTAAEVIGVDVDEIKGLNPELRRSCTPPNVENYTLRIPSGTKEVFLSNMAHVKEEKILDVQPYIVKKGDTVGKIARRYGVSAQSIIELNSLGKRAFIVAGSRLLIPSQITVKHGDVTGSSGTRHKKKTGTSYRGKTSI